MQEFEGKVAVVTGGASGMGRAFSDRFARAGMSVVLADYEQGTLDEAVQQMQSAGFDVRGALTDVSDADSVQGLAQLTLDAFGHIDIVCNNAGVLVDRDSPWPITGRQARVWEHSLSDWRWTLDVNLWGVIHGIRTFVPIMLEQDEPGHVVNTASVGGLNTGPGAAIYGTSKHAVVRLSEALYFQLKRMDSKVKVSVLCPGGVRTRIAAAERNRPPELRDGAEGWDAAELARLEQERLAERPRAQLEPETVAEQLFEAIRDEQFYVVTPDVTNEGFSKRFDDILARRNP